MLESARTTKRKSKERSCVQGCSCRVVCYRTGYGNGRRSRLRVLCSRVSQHSLTVLYSDSVGTQDYYIEVWGLEACLVLKYRCVRIVLSLWMSQWCDTFMAIAHSFSGSVFRIDRCTRKKTWHLLCSPFSAMARIVRFSIAAARLSRIAECSRTRASYTEASYCLDGLH